MAVDAENVRKVFGEHLELMKAKSQRWFFKGNSRWADSRIRKFLEYFAIPIDQEDVIALMDTTLLHTGKEGYLFTTSGIVIKDLLYKLCYIDFNKVEQAEVIEEFDEKTYSTTLHACAHLKDGTDIRLPDYYINSRALVRFINDVVQP